MFMTYTKFTLQVIRDTPTHSGLFQEETAYDKIAHVAHTVYTNIRAKYGLDPPESSEKEQGKDPLGLPALHKTTSTD